MSCYWSLVQSKACPLGFVPQPYSCQLSDKFSCGSALSARYSFRESQRHLRGQINAKCKVVGTRRVPYTERTKGGRHAERACYHVQVMQNTRLVFCMTCRSLAGARSDSRNILYTQSEIQI